MANINFRPADDDQHQRLTAAAKANSRSIAVEMRAAIDVYLKLLDLAKLREETKTNPQKLTPKQRGEVTFAIRDEIGRILLAAVSREARLVFENSAGVEYPVGEIGRIVIPFDRIIDWIACGKA